MMMIMILYNNWEAGRGCGGTEKRIRIGLEVAEGGEGGRIVRTGLLGRKGPARAEDG